MGKKNSNKSVVEKEGYKRNRETLARNYSVGLTHILPFEELPYSFCTVVMGIEYVRIQAR